MDEINTPINNQAPKLARVAMVLGIASVLSLLAAVILGILVPSIGMVSLLGVVSGVALAAIICAILALKKIAADTLPGRNAAIAGLILGVVALLLTIFLRIAVFLFFIPWLGA